jgi:chromosome segregation ATPase
MSAKKAAKQSVGNVDIESAQKVERIRNIVFGSQMREYEQRFANINRDITRVQQEIAQTNEQLLTQIRQVNNQIHEVSERLGAKLNEQSRLLTTHINEVENAQSAKVSALDARLSGQLREQESNLALQVQKLTESATEQTKHLQQAIHALDDDIRSELRSHAERLGETKMDRSTLGQLLIEMGNDLQEGVGGSVFSKLMSDLDGLDLDGLDLDDSADDDAPDEALSEDGLPDDGLSDEVG